MSAIPMAPEQDAVLSTRVRLARNYEDIPFAPKLTDENAEVTIRRAEAAIAASDQAGAFHMVRIRELPQIMRRQLVEKHLISEDLLKYENRAAALISSGETVSVMINEEDHLRIQGMLPGLQLDKSAEMALSIDDVFERREPFAFDSKLGYLTCLPTNTGTGMRASILMHLPGMAQCRQIGAITQAVAKLGLTVREYYGEGGEAQGNLYLLSNQVTLGRSEEDMIRSLNTVASQIIEKERNARQTQFTHDPDAFTDRVMRSVGVMMNARLMGIREFMQLFSDLRYAVALGILSAPIPEIDKLMTDMQPAALSVKQCEELDARQEELLRADELRTRLTEMIGNK